MPVIPSDRRGNPSDLTDPAFPEPDTDRPDPRLPKRADASAQIPDEDDEQETEEQDD